MQHFPANTQPGNDGRISCDSVRRAWPGGARINRTLSDQWVLRYTYDFLFIDSARASSNYEDGLAVRFRKIRDFSIRPNVHPTLFVASCRSGSIRQFDDFTVKTQQL